MKHGKYFSRLARAHTIPFASAIPHKIICVAMLCFPSIRVPIDDFRSQTFVYILVCSFLQPFAKRLFTRTWAVFSPSFVLLPACLVGWLVGVCGCSIVYFVRNTDTYTQTHAREPRISNEKCTKFNESFMNISRLYLSSVFSTQMPNSTEYTAFNYDNECFIPRNKQM